MEIEKEREMVREIKHEFHWHPLVWVEVGEQSNQSEKIYCSGCGDVVLGPCFSCSLCKYHLHERCAEAPLRIGFHPLHRRHSGFFLRESPAYYDWYFCKLCKEKRNMFFYECCGCSFSLDIKCALFLHNFGENFNEFKDDDFQHQFIFLENHKDEVKNFNCFLCHEYFVASIYVSSECKFYFHKKCFESCIEIDHPCHRMHTLILQFSNENRFCKICQKEDDYNLFYHCFACKFYFHFECVWPNDPSIKDEKYHEHSFTLFWKQEPFICNACGIEGNYVCYICSICHIQLHKNCIFLRHIIKVSQHSHVLFHNYYFKKNEFEKHECQICFDEVKTEYGSYRCPKEDCYYIVHVDCAIQDDILYYTINQENQVEELDEQTKVMGSSITCVIQVNEHGEATEIEHLSHEHNLLLEDKIKKDNDRNCDGCMLSISIPFYYCSECNFFLHKTCAELPKIQRHRPHRFNGTLEFKEFSKCALCKHFCSGLFYKNDDSFFCVRCATVPNRIKCEGHEHFLFFDYQCKGKCNACGVDIRSSGAFRCKKCAFVLDFACLTLPLAIQHKSDDHLLKLAYDGENDDTKQHYCDICEEKRDPSLWYYHCSTCDNSAHPECVLGKFPFVKDGVTWGYSNHLHFHNLIFVQKVDGYPKCFECGELCQDQTLKCSTCTYFLHSKCLPSWRLARDLTSERNFLIGSCRFDILAFFLSASETTLLVEFKGDLRAFDPSEGIYRGFWHFIRIFLKKKMIKFHQADEGGTFMQVDLNH